MSSHFGPGVQIVVDESDKQALKLVIGVITDSGQQGASLVDFNEKALSQKPRIGLSTLKAAIKALMNAGLVNIVDQSYQFTEKGKSDLAHKRGS